MNCSSCGREVRPDSVFCHHCGAKIETTDHSSQRPFHIWLLANAVGLAIGLDAAWLVDQIALGYLASFFSPSVFGWAATGVSIGIAQYYALKRLNHPLSRWWIIVTAIALPAGIMLGSPLTFIVGLFSGGLAGNTSNDVGAGLALTGCMAGFAAAFIGGGIVGLTQSVFFQRRAAVTRQWVGANMLGWAIGGAIYGAMQLWLSVGLHLRWEENSVWLIVLPLIGVTGGIISGKITFSSLSNELTPAPDMSSTIQG